MLAGTGVLYWLPGMRMEAIGSSTQRELRVISGQESASARQMLQALKARFPSLVTDADPAAFDGKRGPAVYVSIGAQSLQRALGADLKAPLLSLMTSSQSYRQLVAPEGGGAKDRPNVSAVFADAAPTAQLQLISAIFDSRVTVGTLLSDASAYLERPLRQAATQAGIELLIEKVAPSADVVRALTRLRGAQVLLAVPDGTLYTPDTLRSILESTYRRAMPVIGFSAATVAAGTLATAYCTIDDMVADLADWLDDLGNGPLPEPRFARYWRVAVNESVARSLGVPIDDKVRQLGNHPGGKQP